MDTLGLKAQAALLRFLQDGTYRRVGGAKPREADVRVIVATNADLLERVEMRQFRRDLLYRLDVVTLRIPPLRERDGDAFELAEVFLERLRTRYSKPALSLHAQSLDYLRDHTWPGNVRELENAVHRAVLMSEDGTVRLGNAGRQ